MEATTTQTGERFDQVNTHLQLSLAANPPAPHRERSHPLTAALRIGSCVLHTIGARIEERRGRLHSCVTRSLSRSRTKDVPASAHPRARERPMTCSCCYRIVLGCEDQWVATTIVAATLDEARLKAARESVRSGLHIERIQLIAATFAIAK